jgi:hypothetical protein
VPTANFEELLETAWVTALNNRQGITALAVAAVRWRPLSEYVGQMESSRLGLVTVRCGSITPAARFGNTLSAAPGRMEITAWTMLRHDPVGTYANNLMGEIRDLVSQANIHTILNLTPRLVVYANGAYIDGETLNQTVDGCRQLTVTVATHATATS